MRSKSFAPVAGKDACVLILGSLPGQVSLERQQYYAQARNAFWPIMDELVGASPALPYKERLATLTRRGIALWDVCGEAYRPGSLDSDIEQVVPNDFAAFFKTHPKIKRICFNGAKAYEIYRRKVLPGLPAAMQAIPHQVLPSTSPAHASLSLAQKLKRWRTGLST